MSHTKKKNNNNNLYCVSDDSNIKNILYEISNNVTKVDLKSSYCNVSESMLAVDWINGNRFEMSFIKNNDSYELSKIHISLNASDIPSIKVSGKIINLFLCHTISNY